MSHDEAKHAPTMVPPRNRRWLLLSAAVALFLVAWLTSHYPPIAKASAIEDVSPSYNLLAAGALPWCLQSAGVTLAILGCCGSRITRAAAVFAIAVSFTLAAIWWCGLAIRFYGMDPQGAILDVTTFQIQSQIGASSTFDFILFNFIGPILGPFQLRGPVNLQNWNFLAVMLSTTLLVGYLLIVGHVCRIGIRFQQVSDYVRFVAAMLPCFVPPLISLGIRIAQSE